MTQRRNKTTIIITVRLLDGSLRPHEYVFDYPTSDEDAATVRELAEAVRNALSDRSPGFIRLFHPLVWYRSSQISSVSAELQRNNEDVPPAEVRRIGFV